MALGALVLAVLAGDSLVLAALAGADGLVAGFLPVSLAVASAADRALPRRVAGLVAFGFAVDFFETADFFGEEADAGAASALRAGALAAFGFPEAPAAETSVGAAFPEAFRAASLRGGSAVLA